MAIAAMAIAAMAISAIAVAAIAVAPVACPTVPKGSIAEDDFLKALSALEAGLDDQRRRAG
jgi:hypothetical protein